MKWGVRRTQEELGHKNLKKAKTANLDKWGKTRDTNVLYISGVSGSGKSTVAQFLKKKNTDVIHLDLYFEQGTSDLDQMNPSFNRFLAKNKITFPSDAKSIQGSKEYGRVLDNFAKAVEEFGKEQFKKGRAVIAEGVQVTDSTLRQDLSYYKSKPVILMQTNSVLSMQRAFLRDGRGNLIKGLVNLDSAKSFIDWYSSMSVSLSETAKITGAKRGEKWVKEYLKQFE